MTVTSFSSYGSLRRQRQIAHVSEAVYLSLLTRPQKSDVLKHQQQIHSIPNVFVLCIQK